MMGPPQPASDRLYLAVKQQLLEGAFRPGERIDAAQLAERHFASVTPVRAALQRLAGERLVDARPSEGFHAPRVTELGLRDLYVWNQQIVFLAWRLAAERAGGKIAEAPLLGASDDPVVIAEGLFSWVGGLTGNEHCVVTLQGLNDHLHLVRRLEAQLFDDALAELAALVALWGHGRSPDIRRALNLYHRRRLRASMDIVRLLHRTSPPAP